MGWGQKGHSALREGKGAEVKITPGLALVPAASCNLQPFPGKGRQEPAWIRAHFDPFTAGRRYWKDLALPRSCGLRQDPEEGDRSAR